MIKFYDSNGKYWGEVDETRGLFIPSEEVLADRKTEPQICSFGLHTDCSLCLKESHCKAIKEAERSSE